MKRLKAVILTAVMVLSLSLQALAAPSVSSGSDDGISSDQGYVTADAINTSLYARAVLDIADKINNATENITVADALGDSVLRFVDETSKETSQFADPAQLHFLTDMKQITFHDVEPSEDNPVKVTFTVNNATSDMDVYVLYYCPEHECWELIKTTRTADNQVTAAFHAGTSVYALVYFDKGAAADGSEGTAPQTGESNLPIVLAVAALVCIAFGIFAVRKSKKTA